MKPTTRRRLMAAKLPHMNSPEPVKGKREGVALTRPVPVMLSGVNWRLPQ